MDEGKQVEAKIKWINGGTRGKPTYGVIIDLNTTPEAGWEDSKEQLEQKEKKAHKGFWRWIFGG